MTSCYILNWIVQEMNAFGKCLVQLQDFGRVADDEVEVVGQVVVMVDYVDVAVFETVGDVVNCYWNMNYQVDYAVFVV